ncbi:hypothetical protein ACFW04_010471 [Cataglyphis niger]
MTEFDSFFPRSSSGSYTVVSSGALDGVVSRLMSSEALTLLPRRRQISVHSKIGRGVPPQPSGSIVTGVPVGRNLTARYILEKDH